MKAAQLKEADVIVTCVDDVNWLCSGVHTSSRHLSDWLSWCDSPGQEEKLCLCMCVWMCFQGFDCSTQGGEERLYFCWIISVCVWDLIRALKVQSLQVTVLTKFLLMSKSD